MVATRQYITQPPSLGARQEAAARPLRAAVSPPAGGVGLVHTHSWHAPAPLPLESGAVLQEWTLAYEAYGRLNAARDNVILIMHALSGDAHVAGRLSPDDRKPGWWDAMVGPGRAFDTNRFYVLCANVLGGCRGSTGPSSINPQTGRPYRLDFPVITIGDMVAAQVQLLDAMGITQVRAAVGGSMGGMQVIELAVHHPERIRLAVPLATTARSTAQAIAWSSIGRRAITNDPAWAGGNYQSQPANGLALARMIAHMTYVSEERLDRRFDRQLQSETGLRYVLDREFAIESYLDYQGQSFVARFDANSYLYITKAMDYWDVAAGAPSVAAAFAQARCRWLVASYSSDWLYPPAESEAMVDAIRRSGGSVAYHAFSSSYGHDAFLLEEDALTPVLQEALDE